MSSFSVKPTHRYLRGNKPLKTPEQKYYFDPENPLMGLGENSTTTTTTGKKKKLVRKLVGNPKKSKRGVSSGMRINISSGSHADFY